MGKGDDRIAKRLARLELEQCQEDWDAMAGDETVRHCTVCRSDVYNVASMSRTDAAELLRANDKACLRLLRRADGTVVTREALAHSARRAPRRVGASLAAAFAGTALSTAAIHGLDEASSLSADVAAQEELVSELGGIKIKIKPPAPSKDDDDDRKSSDEKDEDDSKDEPKGDEQRKRKSPPSSDA